MTHPANRDTEGEDLRPLPDDRWRTIVNTCNDLARYHTVSELLAGIAEGVKTLGFERVRIYQYVREEGAEVFAGRKAIGFDPEKDEEFRTRDPAYRGTTRQTYFETRYRIQILQDEPSQDTRNREHPALCIWDPSRTEVDRSTPNVVVYPSRRDTFILDSESVHRWVEVLLLIPPEQPAGTADRTPILWGKISADRGADSDSLRVADLAALALFASIVGGYLAVVAREEEDRRILKLYRDFNERISDLLQHTERKEIHSRLQLELVDLFAQLTGADVVYFRKMQGGRLVLKEAGIYWKDLDPNRHRPIAPVLNDPERYSGQFLDPRFVTPNGQWVGDRIIPPRPPFCHDNLRCAAPESDDEPPDLPEGERFRHALFIPVIVEGDRFRGVIVAMSRDRRLADRWNSVEPFIDSANLWYQLATNSVNRKWAENTLANIMPMVPRLADVPTDSERFNALLALLLTANQGLAWNRVFIWRATHRGLDLKYAIGGLASDEAKPAQQALMEFLENSQLTDLFEDRLERKGSAPAREEGGFDALYDLTVLQPQIDPIRVPWRGNPSVPFPDWFTPRESNRIHWLDDHPWTEEMNREHPGMFGKVRVYGFPFWCLHDKKKRPEGLVLVDLCQYPELDSVERLAATRLFLDTVAGLIYSQREEQATRADAQHLYSLEHQRLMKKTWEQLSGQLKPFFERLPSPSTDPDNVSDLVVSQLASEFRLTARDLLGDDPKGNSTPTPNGFLQPIFLRKVIELRHLIYRQQRRADRLSQLGEGDTIPDLLDYLRTLVSLFESTHGTNVGIELHYEQKEWEEVVNLSIPPRLLFETFESLIENSLGHNPSIRPIPIRIHLRWEGTGFDLRTVCIDYRDRGKGIDPTARNSLFLSGFHRPANPDEPTDALNRGKGLHLALRSISLYGGQISFEEREPDPEDAECLEENAPAVFSIRFLCSRIQVGAVTLGT